MALRADFNLNNLLCRGDMHHISARAFDFRFRKVLRMDVGFHTVDIMGLSPNTFSTAISEY